MACARAAWVSDKVDSSERITSLLKLRTRVLLPVGISALGLLAAWVALVPAEAQLGNLIKLVLVHGALVLVGLFSFSLAGLLGLLALVTRRGPWYRGATAAGLSALVLWAVVALSAMAVTWLTWGQAIAWNEPRVRVTALILGAAAAVEVVIRLVGQRAFGAAARVVMGIAPWVATQQAEVIRHPVDPIGASGSSAIQTYFLLIMLTVALLALDLMALVWATLELSALKSP
jgi:hypothetical protein